VNNNFRSASLLGAVPRSASRSEEWYFLHGSYIWLVNFGLQEGSHSASDESSPVALGGPVCVQGADRGRVLALDGESVWEVAARLLGAARGNTAVTGTSWAIPRCASGPQTEQV
jgi:hypothetical protein